MALSERHNSSEYLDTTRYTGWELAGKVDNYDDLIEELVYCQELGLYFRGYEYYFEPYTYYAGDDGVGYLVGGKLNMDGDYVEFFDVMNVEELAEARIFDGLKLIDAYKEMMYINY